MGDFNIKINTDDVNKTLKDLKEKISDLSQRLSEDVCAIGAVEASLAYSRTALGERIPDVNITVKKDNANSAMLIAQGKDVLFSEFGTGIRYGNGHPSPHGYGAGTYPSDKQNWKNPKGWYYSEDGITHHTYGNAPSAAMYNASKKMVESIQDVVRNYLK